MLPKDSARAGHNRAILRSPAVHPFMGFDMPRLLEWRARTRGDHPFLVWAPFDGPGDVWSYRRFAAETAAVAAGLKRRGVGPGDHVMLHMDNCPEMLLAWHACARLGAVAVTTNTRSSAEEISYFAGHCAAVGAITQPRYGDLLGSSCPGLRWIVCTDGSDTPAGRQPAAGDSFASLFVDASDAPLRDADPLRPLSIQYTSGTTARPKAVVWTHANGLWGARMAATHERLQPDDVHLVVLPLYHTNAQCYSMLATLYAGATAVLQPRFSASRFWPVSLKHGCTYVSLVGFCLRALAAHERPEKHSYRVFAPAVAHPMIEEKYGVRTLGFWGMTETVAQCIVTDFDREEPPMSIGRPALPYEVAVLDDDGRPASAGGTGHLLVRGVRGLSLFSEYLHDPEATAAAFDPDGYFRTGDRVTILESGAMLFADRDKDMLKVGGENVAASEIEAVIMGVPGVREVAVVAQKHPMLEETPVAFVLLTDDAPPGDVIAKAVLGACAARLADFKVPSEVRIVSELPRATLEKVAKAKLRQQLDDETAQAS